LLMMSSLMIEMSHKYFIVDYCQVWSLFY
jgi:hypothetical protein